MLIKLLRRRYLTLATIIAALAISLGLNSPTVLSQSPATIKIDGSSTVFPITEAVAEDFQKSKNGSVRVTVGISGTGGGFKKFCNGDTDISNASRPIKATEREACSAKGIEFIELPVAYDALTIVVNKANTWIAGDNISTDDLKKIWDKDAQGKVMKWGDVRSEWSQGGDIKLYGPGTDSGTFDYFTEAINGKSGQSRSDYTPSEDDNVLVQGVARDKGAMGYFGFAYYEENMGKLKALKVNGVEPSKANVISGTYQPLSRPLFIYISKKAADRSDVKEFVSFYLKNGAKLVDQVQYIPLPGNSYDAVLNRFNRGEVGTVFAERRTIGVPINDLMQLEGAK